MVPWRNGRPLLRQSCGSDLTRLRAPYADFTGADLSLCRMDGADSSGPIGIKPLSFPMIRPSMRLKILTKPRAPIVLVCQLYRRHPQPSQRSLRRRRDHERPGHYAAVCRSAWGGATAMLAYPQWAWRCFLFPVGGEVRPADDLGEGDAAAPGPTQCRMEMNSADLSRLQAVMRRATEYAALEENQRVKTGQLRRRNRNANALLSRRAIRAPRYEVTTPVSVASATRFDAGAGRNPLYRCMRGHQCVGISKGVGTLRRQVDELSAQRADATTYIRN